MKQCPSSGRRNRLIQQEMTSAGVEGGWAEEGSEKAFGGGSLELPGWRHLVICRGRGWGCFRRASSLTKGLERGRQGATSNSTWLGRARNGWNPQPGTVACSVHYLRPHPSPPVEYASSHSQMSGDSHGDDLGPANTAFTSTVSHRLSGPENLCAATSHQHLLGVLSTCSHGRRGKTSHSGPSSKIFFFSDWILKYSDLWLLVQFNKVIFPDAVILGLLTHQGCSRSHPPAPSPSLTVGTNPHPRAPAQA